MTITDLRSSGKLLQTISGLSLIGMIEAFLFFQNPGHFFQGDTLYWLANRYKSVAEFVAGFLQLDPSGWYRPLSQRTVESLLLPLAGLNPIPYRWLTFCLFFICTIAVFVLIDQISGRRRAAWIGTLFFSTHVTHAYTTYDVAFTPELLYTLFYVGSAILYVSYLRTERRRDLIGSCLLFAGSLMSKEAAITLPFSMAAIWLLLPGEKRSAKSLAPYFLILGVYLIFAVGYLHVGGLEAGKLWENPTRAGLTGYELSLGSNVLQSLRTGVRWAFNFPGGQHGQWQLPERWMFNVLRFFRLVVFGAAALLLFSSRRKILLLGALWFLIVSLPMLPLLDHFLPYYLFGPLVGVALAIGVSLDEGYTRVSPFTPSLARATLAILFAFLSCVNAVAIWDAAEHQPLLGEAAQSALNAVDDLRALYPRLPKGAKLVFLNEEAPTIWWNHAQGGLFQMSYDDAEITAEYSSLGTSVSSGEAGPEQVFFLNVKNGRIVRHVPYHVELSKSVVRAGLDSYSLRVPELPMADVDVLYSYNATAMKPFRIRLDSRGEVEFKVDRTTQPGTYTIIGIKRSNQLMWVKTDASVEVKTGSR